MSFYVLYDAAGTLLSSGTVIASPLPAGLTAKDITNPPAPGMVWSPAVLNFIAAPAPRTVAVFAFLSRFTQPERAGILASADANVRDFLNMLNHAPAVNLDDTLTQNGVNYLVSIALLTSARATAVLA